MRCRVQGDPIGSNGVQWGTMGCTRVQRVPTGVPYGSSGILLNLLNCQRIQLNLKSKFLICWFNIMILILHYIASITTPRLLETSE